MPNYDHSLTLTGCIKRPSLSLVYEWIKYTTWKNISTELCRYIYVQFQIIWMGRKRIQIGLKMIEVKK